MEVRCGLYVKVTTINLTACEMKSMRTGSYMEWDYKSNKGNLTELKIESVTAYTWLLSPFLSRLEVSSLVY
jgi:hypothetical protein